MSCLITFFILIHFKLNIKRKLKNHRINCTRILNNIDYYVSDEYFQKKYLIENFDLNKSNLFKQNYLKKKMFKSLINWENYSILFQCIFTKSFSKLFKFYYTNEQCLDLFKNFNTNNRNNLIYNDIDKDQQFEVINKKNIYIFNNFLKNNLNLVCFLSFYEFIFNLPSNIEWYFGQSIKNYNFDANNIQIYYELIKSWQLFEHISLFWSALHLFLFLPFIYCLNSQFRLKLHYKFKYKRLIYCRKSHFECCFCGCKCNDSSS